jgi:hypothetical protein
VKRSSAAAVIYRAQLRRARVLPTTVRAATVVEKHIIEHYSRSLFLLLNGYR